MALRRLAAGWGRGWRRRATPTDSQPAPPHARACECGCACRGRIHGTSWTLLWPLLLLLLLLGLLPSRASAQTAPTNAQFTLSCGNKPALRTGWIPGGADSGGQGVCWYSDPKPDEALQTIHLQDTADVGASPLPSTLTLGSLSNQAFSLSMWFCLGAAGSYSATNGNYPGLIASGGGTHSLTVGFAVHSSVGYVVAAAAELSQSSYGLVSPFGQANPWRAYQWVHVGVSFQGSQPTGAWQLYFNAKRDSQSFNPTWMTTITPNDFKWGKAIALETTSGAMQGGFAELRVWHSQTTPLSPDNFLYLAQNPPSVLVAMPPHLESFPTVMDRCSAPGSLTVRVYPPFDFKKLWGISSVTLTVTPAAGSGISVANSAVILSDASLPVSWLRGSFSLSSAFLWGTSSTVSFESSSTRMGAPTTRTVLLKTGSVVAASATLMTQFGASISSYSTALSTPSGQGRLIRFGSFGLNEWAWSADNLGAPAAFPSTWSGKHGYTFEFWLRFTQVDMDNMYLLNNRQSSSTASSFRITLSVQSKLVVVTSAIGSTLKSVTWTVPSFAINTDYQLVITADTTGNVRVYLNKVPLLVQSTTEAAYPVPLPIEIARTTTQTESITNTALLRLGFWLRPLDVASIGALFDWKPVTVRVPGVSSLVVHRLAVSNDPSTPTPLLADGTASMSPSFVPGDGGRLHTIQVPYKVLALTFTVALAGDTASLEWGCGAGNTVSLSSSVPSAQRQLLSSTPSVQQFQVTSSHDGLYTLHVHRAEPDVRSIALHGWTASGVSTGVIATTFAVGKHAQVFPVSVLSSVAKISVTVMFDTGSTVSISLSGVVVHASGTVASGTDSDPVSLPAVSAGPSRFVVVSTRDGSYTFEVTRIPIVSEVSFSFHQVSLGVSETPQSLASFDTGTLTGYAVQAPYKWDAFDFAIGYPSGSVSYTWAGGVATPAPPTLALTTVHLPLPAAGTAGASLLLDTPDGTYSIQVSRAAQQVSGFGLRCDSDGLTAQVQSFSPAFTAGTVGYSAALGGQWSNCDVSVSYGGGSTATIAVSSIPYTGAAPASGSFTTELFPLPIGGTLTVLVSSSTDGEYTLSISRAGWVVSSGELEVGQGPTGMDALELLDVQLVPGQLTGYQFLEVPFIYTGVRVRFVFVGSVSASITGGGSVALTSGVWSDPFMIGPTGIHYLRVVSPVEGTYEFAAVRMLPSVQAVSIVTNPASTLDFTPGVWSDAVAYTIPVPFRTDALQLSATFSAADTVSFTVNSVLISASLTSDSSAGTTAPLNVGANALVLSSTEDGDYLFTVTRAVNSVHSFSLRCDNAAGTSPFALASVTPGTFTYSATLSAQWFSCALSIDYSSGADDTLTIARLPDGAEPAPLSGEFTASIPLQLDGDTVVLVSSTNDGQYTLTISRGDWGVSSLALQSGSGETGDANPAPLVFDPLFTPGSFEDYGVAVDFVVSGLRVAAEFATTATVEGVTSGDGPIALVSGAAAWSSTFLLATGPNVFRIESPEDGPYTVTVTRAVQDVHFLQLHGSSTLTGAASTALSLSPPWQAGVRTYNVAVGAPMDLYTFNLTFGTEGSVTARSGGIVLADPLSGADSTPLSLPFGSTILEFDSVLDGPYRIDLTRSPGDVSQVLLHALPNPLALVGAPGGADAPALLVLTPAFFGGVFFAYDAIVPFVYNELTLTPSYHTVDSLRVLHAPSAYDSAVASGTPSDRVSLEEGVNTVLVESARDGIYEFSITRRAPDLLFEDVELRAISDAANVPSALLSLTQPDGVTASAPRSGVYAYAARVPYALASLTLRLAFQSTDPDSAVLLRMDGAPAEGVALQSDTVTAPLGLHLGPNIARIDSPLDGSYYITVTRASLDLTALQVQSFGNAAADPAAALGDLSGDLVLADPLPAGFVSAHTLDVGFVVRAVRLQADFTVPDSVLFGVEAEGTEIAPLPLHSATPSAVIALPVGLTVIHINSTQDGMRLLHIRRAAPAVSAIAVSAQLRGSDEWVAVSSASLSLQLQPSFDPLASMAYELSLPFIAVAVRLSAHFSAGLVHLASSTSPTADALTLPLQMDDGSDTVAAFTLRPHPTETTFTLRSDQDGPYLLSIKQSAPDMVDIVLVGYVADIAGGDDPLSTPVVFDSPFAPGSMEHTARVPFKVERVAVRLSYATSDSVVMLYTSDPALATPAPLSGEESSDRFDLVSLESESDPTPNVLTLISSRDGNYTLHIVREPASLRALQFRSGEGGDGSVAPASLFMTPPFMPGVWNNSYTLVFPRIKTALALWASFTAGSVHASMMAGQPPLALVSETWTGAGSLALMLPPAGSDATLTLLSSTDSIYTILVRHLPADVVALSATGTTVAAAGGPGSPSKLVPLAHRLQPAFAPGDGGVYQLRLPSLVAQVAFVATFGVADSLTLVRTDVDDVTVSAPVPLVSGVHSANFPLQSGSSSLFDFSSTQDGVYSINVTRSAPDLVALELWQVHVDPSGALAPAPLPAPTDTWVPRFQPGVVFAYSVALPSTVAHVALLPTFGVSGSVNLSSSSIASGGTSPLVSGSLSPPIPLASLPLTNTMRVVSSEDGVYTLLVTRANFDPCVSAEPRCLNGGRCVPAVDASVNPPYTCNCTYGFTGFNCSVCVAASSSACPVPPVTHLQFVSPPASVAPCSTLELRVAATGFDAEVLLYSFRIESITLEGGRTLYANESSALAPVSPFNETLGVSLGRMASESVLHLPAHQMWDNASYVFLAEVGTTTRAAQQAGGIPAPVWSAPVRTVVRKESSAGGVVAWMPSVVVTPPPLLTRSSRARFQAKVLASSCAPLPHDVQHHFEWSVLEHPVNGTEGGEGIVVLRSKPAMTFEISPNTLRTEVTYTLTLLLTSSSASAAGPAVLGSRRLLAQTFLSGSTRVSLPLVVTPQPLVASIKGGRQMTSVDVSFELDADESADPDWSGLAQPRPVLFQWSASYVPSPNPGSVAPVSLPLSPLGLVLDASKLRVPAYTFLSLVGTDRTIVVTFYVRVSSRSHAARTADASVEVEVVPKPPLPLPRVVVSIPSMAVSSSAAGFVNPTHSLTMVSSVDYNSTGALANNSTGSSGTTKSVHLRYRWLCVEPASLSLDLRSSAVVSSTIDAENLVIRPNQLTPGLLHRFRLVVSDPAFDAAPLPPGASPPSGYGEAVVMVNQPPRRGACTVSPASGGESLSTQFVISCSGWSDPQGHEPLRYSFSYTNLDSDPTRSRAPSLLSGYSYTSTLQTMLPAGQLELVVAIGDTLDAAAYSTIGVNVSLPLGALTDPACFVKNMSQGALAAAMAQQDSAASFLLITQLSSVLNSAGNSTCNDGSSNSTGGGGADELRQELLENLAGVAGTGTNSTMSPETLQLVSQALDSLTAAPNALNNSATWDLTDAILKDAIASIPPSSGADYSAITDSLANTASNLLLDCSKLDSVSGLTQSILSAVLNGTVAGAGNALNTTNLQASAVRSNIDGGANVTLASGVSVYLSAEALLQYANQLGASGATLALDTRVVTFDPRWASCRNNSGSGVISSELTTIDITLSDGKVVDLSQLLAPITFFLPFNMTRFLEEHPPEPIAVVKQNCTNLINSTAPANGTIDEACPAYLASALTCSYWDVVNKSYSTAGCRNEGFVQNCTAVQCSCGHLTEFAVIYQASLRRQPVMVVGECGEEYYQSADGESTLGLQYYLIFFSLYSLVALVASVQLGRILASSRCRHWLMAVEHALVLSVSLFRAWNMLNYWRLYQYVPMMYVTIISGVPHLFTSWIFTFVIFAWASIYHNSVAGRREENPFRAYQSIFIAINTLVSGCLFALFALMSQSGLDKQQLLYESGVTLTAIVNSLFAIFFILYGMLLVRSLTKDFSSPYARKLFVVAVGFSCAFFASSGILLLSVLEGDYYNTHLMSFNCAYFSLDLLVLAIVMALFGKSVSDSIASRNSRKMEEGSMMSGTAATVGSSGKRKMMQSHASTVNANAAQAGHHRKNAASVAPSVSRGPATAAGAIASTKVAAPMPDAPVLLPHPGDEDDPWGDWGPEEDRQDADTNPWTIHGDESGSDEGEEEDSTGGDGVWCNTSIPSSIQSPSGAPVGSPQFVRGRIYATTDVANKYLAKKPVPETSLPAGALIKPPSRPVSAEKEKDKEKEKAGAAPPSFAGSGPLVLPNALGMHVRARSSKYVPFARLAHVHVAGHGVGGVGGSGAGARGGRAVTVHLDQNAPDSDLAVAQHASHDSSSNASSARSSASTTPAKVKANGSAGVTPTPLLGTLAASFLSPARATSDGSIDSVGDYPAPPSARASGGAVTPTPVAGSVAASPMTRHKRRASYGRSRHLPPGISVAIGSQGGSGAAAPPSSSLPSSGPPSRQWSRRSSLSDEQVGRSASPAPAPAPGDSMGDRPSLLRPRVRSLSVDQGNLSGNGGLSLSFGTTAQLQVGFLPNIADSPFIHPASHACTPSMHARTPSAYGLDGPPYAGGSAAASESMRSNWLLDTAVPPLGNASPVTPTSQKRFGGAFSYPRSPTPDAQHFRPLSTSPTPDAAQTLAVSDAQPGALTAAPLVVGRGLRGARLPAAAMRFATSAPRDPSRTHEPPPLIRRDDGASDSDRSLPVSTVTAVAAHLSGPESARSHPAASPPAPHKARSYQSATPLDESAVQVRVGWQSNAADTDSLSARTSASASATARTNATAAAPRDSLDSLVSGAAATSVLPAPSTSPWSPGSRLPSPLHSPPAPAQPVFWGRGGGGGRGDPRSVASVAGAFALSSPSSSSSPSAAPSAPAAPHARASMASLSAGRRPLLDAAHTLLHNRGQP